MLPMTFFALWTSLVAHAEPWKDPRWPELFRESELIARVRVTQGGKYGARVQVERAFAGQPPASEFTLVAFNDPGWPLEGVLNEQLQTGDVAWIFARPWEGPRFPEEPTPWVDEGVLAPAGELWAGPAPFAGDVPLRNDGVHVHLLRSGFPHFGRPLPQDDWEALLASAIPYHREGKLDEAAIQKARACVGKPSPTPLERPDLEDPDATCLARLALLGEKRWDPRFDAYSRSPNPMTRAAAAVLALQTEDPRAVASIVRGFLDESDQARLIVAHEARAVRRESAGLVLAPLLAAGRSTPPVRTPVPISELRPEPVRRRIVEALGFLATDATMEALIQELPFLNPDLLFVALDALQRERPGSWVDAAVRLVATPEPARLQTITEIIHMARATQAKTALEGLLGRPDLDVSGQARVMWALEAVGDAGTAQLARERLKPRLYNGLRFEPDTVDLIGAELALLAAVEGKGGLDLAWEVSRLYFGWPGEIGDPAVAGVWLPLRMALTERAVHYLPPGSTVKVRMLAKEPRKVGRVGGEIPAMQLDVHVPEGLTRDHRKTLATTFGLDPSQVRVCGVGMEGYFCDESRGQVWAVHQLIGIPTVRIAAQAAGVQPFTMTGDPSAILWLRTFEAAGLVADAESVAFLDEFRRPPAPTPVVKPPIPGVTPLPGR
jgi:hypothetical protein